MIGVTRRHLPKVQLPSELVDAQLRNVVRNTQLQQKIVSETPRANCSRCLSA